MKRLWNFGLLLALISVPAVAYAEPGDGQGDWNDAGRGVAQREGRDDEGAGRGKEHDSNDDREMTQREAEDAREQEAREKPDPERYGDSGGDRLPEKGDKPQA